jgi:hypothetical protein
MGRGAVHTGFWWGNLSERHRLEDSGVDVMIILKWSFRKCDCGVDWIVWLRIDTDGGLF